MAFFLPVYQRDYQTSRRLFVERTQRKEALNRANQIREEIRRIDNEGALHAAEIRDLEKEFEEKGKIDVNRYVSASKRATNAIVNNLDRQMMLTSQASVELGNNPFQQEALGPIFAEIQQKQDALQKSLEMGTQNMANIQATEEVPKKEATEATKPAEPAKPDKPTEAPKPETTEK